MASARRFFIRTYGCQMNAHDTEKLANLLYHQGYVEAGHPDQAELLLINTCSIREKAEHRLYSDLGMLRQWKAAAPGRILGVGGCVAQQEGDAILRRFGHLDFVFGPHNLRLVPAMIEAAKVEDEKAALRSFTYANEVEKVHAALYEKALANLEDLEETDYYVCSVCGHTVENGPPDECPVCKAKAKAFFKVD